MDLQFAHGVDGFGGLKMVRERWPNTRVLVVTAFADTQTAAAARVAGAAGIVSKEVTLEELYRTIKQAANRGKVRSINGTGKSGMGDAAVAPSGRLAKLSKRELEVLVEIRRGMTNREIALRLGVSTTTVNKHVHGVLAKLGARNRAQAAIVR
jgi:DNA-binding NarL/FixJ family response regulator